MTIDSKWDSAALDALQARISRIEDLEAIKQLKARYCAICDDGHDPVAITSVFTEDGIWEGTGIGTARGHAEIRQLFEGFRQAMTFTQHMTMNPIIELDGDRASGVWTFFGPFTMTKGNRARWQATRYAEQYKKVAGDWKIAHLRIAGPSMSADYFKGWGSPKAS